LKRKQIAFLLDVCAHLAVALVSLLSLAEASRHTDLPSHSWLCLQPPRRW
jgi:hypothetical protein